MPNKIKGYKPSVATTGRMHVSTSRKGDSVKALLERRKMPLLRRVSEQASAQIQWREWLEKRLPEALVPHLSGVVEQGEKLTVFTESAVWSARLRYALAEIETLIKKEQPQIAQIAVRVMPKRSAPPRA